MYYVRYYIIILGDRMKALITGASWIGKDFAIALGNMGYDLILVARNQENLKK